MLGKVLISAQQIASMQAAYNTSGPLSAAIDNMLVRADLAISYTAQSVIDAGSTTCGFPTNKFYCTRGESGANRLDYVAAQNMMQACGDLAIAYQVTGSAAYADKCIALLRHWCLDSVTGMMPDSNYTNMTDGERVQLSITIPGFCLAADLLNDYPGWLPYRADFVAWANAVGASFVSQNSNITRDNKLTWALSLEAACGAISNDMVMIDAAIDYFKFRFFGMVHSNGTTDVDRERAGQALFYQTYHLAAMVLLAEIGNLNAREDLYLFSVSGRSIQSVADTMHTYISDKNYPNAWNAFATANGYGQENADQASKDRTISNSGCFEFLNKRFGTYNDVFIQFLARPILYQPDPVSKRWPLDWTLAGFENVTQTISLFDRLSGVENPRLPIHQFMAAFEEYAEGFVARTDIVSEFNLSTSEEVELDWLLDEYNGSTQKGNFLSTIERIFVLSERDIFNYRTKSNITNRISGLP